MPISNGKITSGKASIRNVPSAAKALGLGLLLVLSAACSSTPSGEIKPADVLYRDAYEALQNSNFQLASDRLNTIMARYPFTPYAVQAHMDSLYALHQLEQADQVAEEAERFIRENPRHPQIEYAYFMKGLAYYRDPPTVLEKLFDVDEATRDISYARKSFQNFRDLVIRFPESEYAVDARKRMVELKYRMARHEIWVAEYYLRRGAWISAINRASNVIENFQGTPSEVDALMILAHGYEKLGLDDLAKEPRAILAANPDRKPVVLKEESLKSGD